MIVSATGSVIPISSIVGVWNTPIWSHPKSIDASPVRSRSAASAARHSAIMVGWFASISFFCCSMSATTRWYSSRRWARVSGLLAL